MKFEHKVRVLGYVKIILHDVFVQLQSIFNSTNINHGQSYPIFGFWLKFYIPEMYLNIRVIRKGLVTYASKDIGNTIM